MVFLEQDRQDGQDKTIRKWIFEVLKGHEKDLLFLVACSRLPLCEQCELEFQWY